MKGAAFLASTSLLVLAAAAPIKNARGTEGHLPTNVFYVVQQGEDGVAAEAEKRALPTNVFYVVGPSEDGDAAVVEKREAQFYSPTNGFYQVNSAEDGVAAEAEKRALPTNVFYVVGPSEDGEAVVEKRQGDYGINSADH